LVITESTLNKVIGKREKPNLDELLENEPEFKCYLRPIIRDEQQGWNFLAENMSTSSRKSVYPLIYTLR